MFLRILSHLKSMNNTFGRSINILKTSRGTEASMFLGFAKSTAEGGMNSPIARSFSTRSDGSQPFFSCSPFPGGMGSGLHSPVQSRGTRSMEYETRNHLGC